MCELVWSELGTFVKKRRFRRKHTLQFTHYGPGRAGRLRPGRRGRERNRGRTGRRRSPLALISRLGTARAHIVIGPEYYVCVLLVNGQVSA